MKTKKTLSDKIFQILNPAGKVDITGVRIEDIKKFIKKLKKNIYLGVTEGEKVGYVDFDKIIDELMGEDLI